MPEVRGRRGEKESGNHSPQAVEPPTKRQRSARNGTPTRTLKGDAKAKNGSSPRARYLNTLRMNVLKGNSRVNSPKGNSPKRRGRKPKARNSPEPRNSNGRSKNGDQESSDDESSIPDLEDCPPVRGLSPASTDSPTKSRSPRSQRIRPNATKNGDSNGDALELENDQVVKTEPINPLDMVPKVETTSTKPGARIEEIFAKLDEKRAEEAKKNPVKAEAKNTKTSPPKARDQKFQF